MEAWGKDRFESATIADSEHEQTNGTFPKAEN
jgi:hypothetical protein